LSAHMRVGSNEPVVLLYLNESSDVHIFADDSNLSRQSFLNGLGGVEFPRLSKKCLNICCLGLHSLLCHLRNIALEYLVLCNEVGLCIYFHCNSLLAILRYDYLCKTFCCNSACFLLSSSQTFLSQEFNCLVHISFGCG